jgi:hypothetical protein
MISIDTVESVYTAYDLPNITIENLAQNRVLVVDPSQRSKDNDIQKVQERLNGFYQSPEGYLFPVVPFIQFNMTRNDEVFVPRESIIHTYNSAIDRSMLVHDVSLLDIVEMHGGLIKREEGIVISPSVPFVIAPKYPMFGPNANHVMVVQPPYGQHQITKEMLLLGDDLANIGFAVIGNPPGCGNSRESAHLQAAKPEEGLEPVNQMTDPAFHIPVDEFLSYYPRMIERGFMFSFALAGNGNVVTFVHCLPLYGWDIKYKNYGEKCIHPMKIIIDGKSEQELNSILVQLELIQREGVAGFQAAYEMINHKDDRLTKEERYLMQRNYARPVPASHLRWIMQPGNELVNPSFREHQHLVPQYKHSLLMAY